MGRRAIHRLGALGLAIALGALSAVPVGAAGFSIFEQGSKAMGMAGAFTAQADDGSAMFHNVGGLGFLDERSFMAGATWIHAIEAEMDGLDPFPGASYSAELKKLSEFPPHFYWVEPLTDSITFGLAVNAPFGLVTEWENPDEFLGRFLSTKAELTGVDINPNLGFRLSENFALGVGAIARLSAVELNRRSAALNPFTLQQVEVAEVLLESDLDQGYGWQIGMLHKAHPNFTWGLSYRSAITVDYDGDATLTQVPTGDPVFDAIVASVTPFDEKLPIATSIEFPDAASLGLAFRLTERVLLETDINWTGWSTFSRVPIDFTRDDLEDELLPQGWDDAMHYRVGVRFARNDRSEWRFGYVFDESPQPDEGVGPLLPDADRNGFTVGYGRNPHGDGLGWDLALMYLPFQERTTTTNRDDFDGTYNTTAVLLAGSLHW